MTNDINSRVHDTMCPSAYSLVCECELIARVRENERMRDDDYRYVASDLMARGSIEGYDRALRDASQAIRGHVISGYFCSCGAEINSQTGHHARVIEALGGERERP